MKKWLGILMLALISVGLIGCKSSVYKHDGTFTAFEVSENYGAPQITWVSVNIKDGAIKSYNIDERQTKDGVWNEKTKKELGYDYGMTGASPIKKEWFEQAESIELYFLKHGPDKLKLAEDGKVDGLVGATMVADHYKRVALKALENAKNGIYSAFEVGYNYGAVQLSWVDVQYNKKGELINYNIDELQSKDGIWNFKTKKELGFDYGMTGASPIGKEWFEQAEAIEDFFLANSPEDIILDSDGYVDNITNATMIASSYRRLAIAARDMRDVLDAPNGKLIGVEEEPVSLEFPYDGKFVAFETGSSYGSPQLTWVEVIVFNGIVHSFYIDERQTTDGVWNEKTKKELGYDYGMTGASPIGKEWFEQAFEIENFFLKFGPDALSLNDKGYVDNITGATMIGESYKKLAKEALDKARNGVYTAFETSLSYGSVQLSWVDVTYNLDGTIKSYYIDELQSEGNVWNKETKKELGFDYNMKPVSPIGKEWFEQAETIEEYFLANKPEDLPVNDEGYVDGVTGATMIATTYKKLAIEARDLNGDFFTGNLVNNGTFTAFETGVSYGAPQLSWVNVVIENGKVKSYYIDERQSKGDNWNAETKKELEFEYGMKPVSPIGKEWFEQAKAIEDFFLANNPWTISLNDEGYVDGIADATMVADSYRDLAIKALINAYYGLHTAFEAGSGFSVTWVHAFVAEGEIIAYYIDTLQSKDKVWNEKTKKELGFDYNMAGASPIDKEWFEQAYVIELIFRTTGPESLVINDQGYIDGVTGATMKGQTYKDLAIAVSKLVK